MSFWYLATPYAKYKDGVEAAYVMACKQTAILTKAGIHVFCPIAHSHSVAVHGNIEMRDHDFWMNVDRPFMEAAHGLIVVLADGWQASRGMAQEILYFGAARKRMIFMTENELPFEFSR